MGKSNESREILRHLRAEKCAQSVCRFVFSHLVSDLNDETNGGGNIIREVLFTSNSPEKFSDDNKGESGHLVFTGQCGRSIIPDSSQTLAGT